MDSTSGQYIEDYDLNDPVVYMSERRGPYFVYQKGRDHWSMGVRSIKDNTKTMSEFALNYPLDEISVKEKEVKRLIPAKE